MGELSWHREEIELAKGEKGWHSLFGSLLMLSITEIPPLLLTVNHQTTFIFPFARFNSRLFSPYPFIHYMSSLTLFSLHGFFRRNGFFCCWKRWSLLMTCLTCYYPSPFFVPSLCHHRCFILSHLQISPTISSDKCPAFSRQLSLSFCSHPFQTTPDLLFRPPICFFHSLSDLCLFAVQFPSK